MKLIIHRKPTFRIPNSTLPIKHSSGNASLELVIQDGLRSTETGKVIKIFSWEKCF
jgi:hypothetical protein